MRKVYYSFLFCFFSLFSLYSQIQFGNVANDLGVAISPGLTSYGNGISFFDYNNDGWDDITISTADNNELRFFKNIYGVFVEQDFNLSYINYQTRCVVWVDFDNDGDNDLFVTSDTNGNKLLKNQGNMIFEDISATSGMVTGNVYTFGASWGDYDNDGYLDVFLSNRTSIFSNILYKNNGDGTFTDVTIQAGINSSPVFSFCSAFLDINNDGHQDIYVSNDKFSFENKLYKNNGDGTFSDISVSSGTNIAIDAMSTTVGDYNKDGYFDIYITNSPTGNYLLKNNGDETFQNVAVPTGTSFDSIGWGAVFFEADNDSDLDLYVSGQLNGSQVGLLSAAFYENNNNNTFTLNNSCFPGDNGTSYSNAVGDIDNDGLLDIVVSNDGQDIFLWKNMTLNSLHWIKLKLEGTQSNKNAIGARVEISVNGEKQYGYKLCGEGYLGQNSNMMHFGLDDNVLIDYIKIFWPSGLEETYFNIQSNQMLTLLEGSALGIDENAIDYGLTVSPNPVTNLLKLESTEVIDTIEVFTVLGQRIVSIDGQHAIQNIDMSNLQSGTYILKVFIKNQTKVIQVLKQ
ncbi:FG-GAP-like repeat-containing protein [Psychroserpens luteolus]|uniref:FG-GAP-like repeat-containing protein n=1 Tax=Psychroserpens luteolus TaxID=2855840 RepID=UPI001E4C35B9|nr:FG-GAP-like repeat-containing protein [Psychroserpens luteolus]MCD2259267.1 VCBS repeat-containing protein [Psychroserpens luteolus]